MRIVCDRFSSFRFLWICTCTFIFDPIMMLAWQEWGIVVGGSIYHCCACPLTTTLCFLTRNESFPLEDSGRLGLEASSKLAVLDLRLLTDTAVGTDDGVFNSRTEFYTINDYFAVFI